MSKIFSKNCGPRTVDIDNDIREPYKFLRLLLDPKNNKKIGLDYIEKFHPSWIGKLEQWQRHFSNNFFDGKRYWISIENRIITLEISNDINYIPEKHNPSISWRSNTIKYHSDCFNEDGTINEKLQKYLGIGPQKE